MRGTPVARTIRWNPPRHLVASADFPLASTIVLCVSGGPAVNCRPREVRWLCFDCYVCPWRLIRPFLFLIPRVLPLIQNISILVGSCPYSLASICWSITLTFSGLILCPCKTKRGIPQKLQLRIGGLPFSNTPKSQSPCFMVINMVKSLLLLVKLNKNQIFFWLLGS